MQRHQRDLSGPCSAKSSSCVQKHPLIDFLGAAVPFQPCPGQASPAHLRGLLSLVTQGQVAVALGSQDMSELSCNGSRPLA